MTDADLAKMGSARVKRLMSEDGKPWAIEKEPVSEVEYAFYRDAAPLLAQLGILTPVVEFSLLRTTKARTRIHS